MRKIIRNSAVSGIVAGAASLATAMLCARLQRDPADAPVNAVSHIASGESPPREAGPHRRNTIVGFALHQGAAIFWAAFFEALFGKRAEKSTKDALAGAIAVAAAAYVTDYHIVSQRFRPGFEVALTRRHLFFVYAALAAGFALCARLRGLHHHQKKDGDERDEGRDAERRPDAMIRPEERRQIDSFAR
jgi:hypothetical protein